jgi:hypothetical protein
VLRILLKFRTVPREPIFEKCSHPWRKAGVLIFPRVLYGGLYGQNLPYKFKNRMVIFGVATSKNQIELPMPGQIWDRIRDPEQTMVLIRPPEFSKTKVFGRRPGRVEQSHSIKSQFKINYFQFWKIPRNYCSIRICKYEAYVWYWYGAAGRPNSMHVC